MWGRKTSPKRPASGQERRVATGVQVAGALDQLHLRGMRVGSGHELNPHKNLALPLDELVQRSVATSAGLLATSHARLLQAGCLAATNQPLSRYGQQALWCIQLGIAVTLEMASGQRRNSTLEDTGRPRPVHSEPAPVLRR